MRALSDREKRTIRLAAGLLLAYLTLFYGLSGFRFLEGKLEECRALEEKAQTVRLEIQRQKLKEERVRALRDALAIDPAKLSPGSLAAEANAAVQKAAQAESIQLGPSRESAGRASRKELSAFQIEGQATTVAAVRFLNAVERLGFPLVIDSLQLKPLPSNSGQVQMSMSLSLLNFEGWKSPSGDGQKTPENGMERIGG